MQRGRARKGVEAPLGAWLWKVAETKGFKTRTDFIRAVGVSPPSVNDWSSEAAAIPKQKTLQKIKDALKLNRDERAELEEKLKEQEAFQQEMLARQAEDQTEPDDAAAPVRADVTTKQVVELLHAAERTAVFGKRPTVKKQS